MNEVNESDSGSALESVVQSQQDCDVASNPTVQSTALIWDIHDAIKAAAIQATKDARDIPFWRVFEFGKAASKATALLDAWELVLSLMAKKAQIEHDAKCDAVD